MPPLRGDLAPKRKKITPSKRLQQQAQARAQLIQRVEPFKVAGLPALTRTPVTPRQRYTSQPVKQRQAQLASTGVLAPKYAATARQTHKEREAGRLAVKAATNYISQRTPPRMASAEGVHRVNRGIEILRDRQKRAEAAERKVALASIIGSGKTVAGPRLDTVGPHRGLLDRTLRFLYPRGSDDAKAGPRTATVPTVAGGFPAKVVKNVGYTIADDPLHQSVRLLKDTGASIASIPAGLYATAKHPGQALDAIAEDYKKRYGPLLEGDEKAFRQRLKKEGVAPEIFDLAGASSAAGGVVGRGAQAAAKAGKLGAKAERIATTRPGLRISGGIVKDQDISPNLLRNVVRAGVDTQRAKLQTKRVANAEKGPGVDAVVQAAEAATQAGTPQVTRMARTYVGRKLANREQRLAGVAAPAARERLAMKIEHDREIHQGYDKTIKNLSKPEQRAFKFALQFGITNAEKAREFLTKHRDEALAQRAAQKMDVPKRQDAIPEIQWLIDNADQAFTERVRKAVHVEGERAAKTARVDPSIDTNTALARRYAAQGALLGIKRADDENATTFARRVRTEAKKQGLDRPGYFPSQKRLSGNFAARALGGFRAVSGDKEWTGALLATARESSDPEQLATAMARNIKRKYNWNTVADHYDRNALSWSKGSYKQPKNPNAEPKYQGKTINEILDEVDRRNIDHGSVMLWNPRKFRESQLANELDDTLDGGTLADDVLNDQAVHDAVAKSSMTLQEAKNRYALNPDEFQNSGFVALPKNVYDEIASFTKPSGAAGRIWDIGKGKVSRVLLANPAWLQFQVASNALLTGLAGTNPIDMAKAQKWWRDLPNEQREAIAPYIGVHKWFDEQTKLGAATNSRLVNGYRAFKQTKFYQTGHKANPLDLLFRADNSQNNFFRKAVLYSKVKREAYHQMGRNANQIMRLQDQIANGVLLKKDPQSMMDAILDNREGIEKMAKHVNDFMGDYQTYTHRERTLMGRSVMFQGFLRFSLKFTFATMPMKHPLLSSILGQMGRLQQDELEKLFGGDVPFWEIGKYYDPKTKQRIDFTRLNPYFNSVRMDSPRSLLTMFPPIVGMAIGQFAQEDALGKSWKIGGSTQEVREDLGWLHPARYKILLAEALRLSPYYRTLEKTGIPGVAEPLRGKQASESSLVFPQGIKYKRADAIARNKRQIRIEEKKGAGGVLKEQYLPLLGNPGAETVRKSKEYQKLYGKKRKKAGRAVSTQSYLENLGKTRSTVNADPVQAYLNSLG